MKKMKNIVVFIPLLITVLFIIIGIMGLIAGQSNEIKIYTSSDLTGFLEKDSGETSKKAVLYADITLKETFEPTELACEFNGNGHTITVDDIDAPCLFDTVTATGSAKNLVLAGKMGGTDDQTIAGVCLRNLGTIENCVIKSDFSDGESVSGVCHTNNGKIANCFVRSNGMIGKAPGYICNPICVENRGSVDNCYYSDASSGEDTVCAYLSGEEMKAENLSDALNEYSENDPDLVGWKTDEKGYPTLHSGNSSQTASVFFGGTGVFLTCMIVLIIAVPIFTIVYADKQKKVIYHKDSDT